MKTLNLLDFIQNGHIKSEDNVVDLTTKPLPWLFFYKLTQKYIFSRPFNVVTKTLLVNTVIIRITAILPAPLAIVDRGAMQCIIGRQFFVEFWDITQAKTVLGLEDKKKTLQSYEGTAVTMMKSSNGEGILISIDSESSYDGPSFPLSNHMSAAGHEI